MKIAGLRVVTPCVQNCSLHGVTSQRAALSIVTALRASDFRFINHLTPNDTYMGRTAQLTSKRCILCIYSTNIGTEYFKHALYSPLFFSSKCSLFHSANLFGSFIIHILYTECAKIKKNNSGAKGLILLPTPEFNTLSHHSH